MSTYSKKPNGSTKQKSTSLRYVKYTILYVLLIPLINWSFTWAPLIGFVEHQFSLYVVGDEIPKAAKWLFNPVTIITGLVLVVRDFAQREIGHEVLFAMAVALGLTALAAGPELAIASGAAFAISELVDWAMFTFTKYKLSTRVLFSSALAAPLDTTIFLYGADIIRDNMLTLPNIVMSIIGKMVGAFVIWWFVRTREMRQKA